MAGGEKYGAVFFGELIGSLSYEELAEAAICGMCDKRYATPDVIRCVAEKLREKSRCYIFQDGEEGDLNGRCRLGSMVS